MLSTREVRQMYVTARERKILEQLFSREETVTIKQVAEDLGISTRTVHRDLKGIESVLEEYGLHLSKQSGGWLTLEGPFENRRQFKRELHQQETVDYTPEERQVLILSKLLESREPVKLSALAADLGVTSATASNDLDKVEIHLESFDLTLVRRRGYGVEVNGAESGIRKAISSLIMKHLNELDLFSILQQNMQAEKKPVSSISGQVLEFVQPDKLTLIETHVDQLRDKLHYPLADSAYIALVIHLGLAIERIQYGEIILMEEEQLDKLRHSKEFEFARELTRMLADAFQLDIPEAETGFITMHLMGAKARYDRHSVLEDSSMSVAFKTKQLITEVTKRTGIHFQQSDRLLHDLVAHLKPSLYRLQHQMGIENTFTDQMMVDYPELFVHIEESLAEVFPDLYFPKEEVAFVVMHFASALLKLEGKRGLDILVVCSSGIGTAKILAAKLQKRFHEIETVEHRSLFELKDMVKENYDVIVSTIELPDIEDYVRVSPVLPQKDVHKLEHTIRRVQVFQHLKEAKKDPKPSLTRVDFRQVKDRLKSWRSFADVIDHLLNRLRVLEADGYDIPSVLTAMTDRLAADGVIPNGPAVLEALLEREQKGGLAIPGTSLALYHTRSEAVKEPSFTVHFTHEPVKAVDMGGEHADVHTILLMLAPADMSREGLETLSYLSSLIVEEEECVAVLESREEDTIVNYLSTKLYEYLQTKQ
nr:BglG family transcription antiterminator [Halobacillus kuroshimensis]